MKTPAISAAELVRLIHYNPKTGVVTNRVSRGNSKAGKLAGHFTKRNKLKITLNGQTMYGHRWIWLYCYGYLPDFEVDHKNGDTSDNRLSNLRLCMNGGVNLQNLRGAYSTSKTNLLGVFPESMGRTGFRSSIMVGGERHYLGWFRSAKTAHAAYVRAKRKLHKFCTI